MLSIAKMSAASEDYFLRHVYYYIAKKRGKKKRIHKGDGPFDDGPDDPDDFDPNADEPFSIDTPGEPPGRWFGNGAEALGLHGIVEEDPYRRVYRGFHPVTQEPLVQNAGKPNRVPGWDLCFTTPKEFGILWGQASQEVRTILECIHDEATRAAVRHLERKYTYSRAGKASEGCRSGPARTNPLFR